MNKGKKRCGSCKWFVGKLPKESEGICGWWDGRVDVDDTYATKCEKFKRKSYQRKRISVVIDD